MKNPSNTPEKPDNKTVHDINHNKSISLCWKRFTAATVFFGKGSVNNINEYRHKLLKNFKFLSRQLTIKAIENNENNKNNHTEGVKPEIYLNRGHLCGNEYDNMWSPSISPIGRKSTNDKLNLMLNNLMYNCLAGNILTSGK